MVKLWQIRKVPIYSNGIKKELVTPTGAAIAVTLAQDFGEPPAMKLSKIGLGAGSRDLEIPNILRLWIGEATETVTTEPPVKFKQETISVLETQVICHPAIALVCKSIIFRETTTLGIRERTQQRSILNRQIQPVATEYGTVRVKIASCGEGEQQQILNVQPEYEDCAVLARKHNIPWREISQRAMSTYLRHSG